MEYDVKTVAKVPKQIIKPEMLVKFAEPSNFENNVGESIGIVTQVTRKWVHVLWLVNSFPGSSAGIDGGKNFFDTRGQHHYITHERRADLVPVPAGTTVTVTQTLKG